jgi:cytochrome c-type biogenesis protein CcmF
MTLGILGEILVILSFAAAIASFGGYLYVAKTLDYEKEKWFSRLYTSTIFFLVAASGILIYLLATHQFQYYYVYNYTSTDLAFRYLISAYYGGQEGSFMLWILISAVVGVGLIKWTDKEYRPMVMAVMAGTQMFLLSMIAGIPIGDGVTLGASPFRTLVEAMPDVPIFQTNPNFIPADGKGLNDLLKSPWMMIHPPILFVGFSMMTVPYAFAMAALWTRKYNEWIKPAFPWVLGANLCLLTAIFLGGYWAYVTLSFGGYWAWDPVENASLVPWLIGVAGIHMMLIQRKHNSAQRSAIFLALLSYVAIVYETFLTRSGILGDASVHSFVDLGLYNQLVLFMAVMVLGGVALYIYRYKDLPRNEKEFSVLSKEWWIFWGATMVGILGLVIIVGTSSPILGKLFQANPTPPEISFYNNWSLPLAVIIAIMTVMGQFLWWKKINDSEQLASELLKPIVLTAVATLATVIIGEVRNIPYMLVIFAGYFAVFGNGFIFFSIVKKKPKATGGTVTHFGFGLLLVGIIASSAYNSYMLDEQTKAYNAAVKAGNITDENGVQVMDEVDMIRIEKGTPTVVNDKFRITYNGFHIDDKNRPGEQIYNITIMNLDSGSGVDLNPVVYPMLQSSSMDHINWAVDPDVYTGMFYDLYLYVAGSKYVNDKNAELQRARTQGMSTSNIALQDETDPHAGHDHANTDEIDQTLGFTKGDSKTIKEFTLTFEDFVQVAEEEKPANTFVAVKARFKVENAETNQTEYVEPMFAVVEENGERVRHAHSAYIESFDLTIRFSNVVPMSDQIEIQVYQGDQQVGGTANQTQIGQQEPDWVLLIAEKKPFVSVVWLGTFMIMAGFSIAIYRRWAEEKQREQRLKSA